MRASEQKGGGNERMKVAHTVYLSGFAMNVFILMLAGAAIGWAGYSFLGFNRERGAIVSMLIGGFGAFVGGKVFAPMFSAAAVPGAFSMSALFFALAAAAAFLAVGNLVHSRWGV